MCLFLLLPFAYFFTESEGLPGKKVCSFCDHKVYICPFHSPPPPSPPLQGMMSRVYETVIVLVMVAVLVLGLLWVVDALTSGDTTTTSHIVVSDLLLFTHASIWENLM